MINNEFLKNITGFINIIFNVVTLISILIFSSILLFLPSEIYQSLEILSLVKSLKPWIAIAWFLSISVLTAKVIIYCAFGIRNRISRSNFIRNLGSDEKAILAHYILTNTTTLPFKWSNAAIDRLVALEVIFMSSLNDGHSMVPASSYSIQPWAWEIVKRNPEYLEPELSEIKRNLENKINEDASSVDGLNFS